MHLLTNAVRAAGDGGHVEIATRHEADTVTITVADDGPGLTAAQLARIFEPDFSRGGRRVKAGLGLFLSQGIAHRHGGRIAATSEPGRGSVFRLHLPAARDGRLRAARD
jgi:signal transduction histidine kinase